MDAPASLLTLFDHAVALMTVRVFIFPMNVFASLPRQATKAGGALGLARV